MSKTRTLTASLACIFNPAYMVCALAARGCAISEDLYVDCISNRSPLPDHAKTTILTETKAFLLAQYTEACIDKNELIGACKLHKALLYQLAVISSSELSAQKLENEHFANWDNKTGTPAVPLMLSSLQKDFGLTRVQTQNAVAITYSLVASIITILGDSGFTLKKPEKQVALLEKLGLPTETEKLKAEIEEAIKQNRQGELFFWKEVKCISFEEWLDAWFKGEAYFNDLLVKAVRILDPDCIIKLNNRKIGYKPSLTGTFAGAYGGKDAFAPIAKVKKAPIYYEFNIAAGAAGAPEAVDPMPPPN